MRRMVLLVQQAVAQNKGGGEKMSYSLSWFKKRTAEINKQFGTHYSPTVLYRRQAALEKVAGDKAVTPFVAQFPTQKVTEQQVQASLKRDFSALSAMDAITYEILHGAYEYYVPTTQTIIKVTDEGIVRYNINTKQIEIVRAQPGKDPADLIPKSARPIDGRERVRLLDARARKIHTEQRKNPYGGYEAGGIEE